VATAIGCSDKTLKKYYRAEIDGGHLHLVVQMVGVVRAAALAGDVKAAQFLLARRGGPEWKEQPGVTVKTLLKCCSLKSGTVSPPSIKARL
jgi:hypothetical protein